MKKPDIARMVARRSRTTGGEAADKLDRVVYQILAQLKAGKPAGLPGLGSFANGPDGKIAFTPEEKRKSG